jgi:hypothetical protein
MCSCSSAKQLEANKKKHKEAPTKLSQPNKKYKCVITSDKEGDSKAEGEGEDEDKGGSEQQEKDGDGWSENTGAEERYEKIKAGSNVKACGLCSV